MHQSTWPLEDRNSKGGVAELLFEGIKNILKRHILFISFQGLMAIEIVLTDAFTNTKRVECMVKLSSIESNIFFVCSSASNKQMPF